MQEHDVQCFGGGSQECASEGSEIADEALLHITHTHTSLTHFRTLEPRIKTQFSLIFTTQEGFTFCRFCSAVHFMPFGKAHEAFGIQH